MGSAPSAALSKLIHLEVDGRIQKVIFSRLSSLSDVRDLLCAAAGLLRGGTLSLFDHKGSPVTIDPEMPANPKSSPYKVVVTSSGPSDREVLLQKFCTDVTVQLSRYLRVDEIESEIRNKLAVLERRVEVESGRRAEIAKCRGEIERLREELAKRSLWICDSPCPPASRRLTPRRDVPSYPKYTLSPETIEALKKPTFDIWQWAPNEMLSCIEYMFHRLGLVNQFNINAITLKRWLLSVQENYRENPFHNFRHSFCVTQTMHGMIQLCELQARLKPIEILILMTSAVCHDLDHPGLNNTYQVNAQTDLARRYGNHSPLEQHHCTVAFQILSEPNCDIFAGTESGVSEEIRKGMTELILATDMARHGDIMDAFDDQNQEHVRLRYSESHTSYRSDHYTVHSAGIRSDNNRLQNRV
ncbi:high affinity cGMP-specific 3',5'-cyclic phosphodiesterase 9A-like isoform X4 [Hemitrygon akajei]|uniref:high affinity cGMP-specific 3',5'-cyclic phosphodiesterase 9A-like isoform X4 n=1 Tax=Hemitrygon akajei TaxID=2704970 RepID=UPI003BF98EF1